MKLAIRLRRFVCDNCLLFDFDFGQATVALMQRIVTNCILVGTRASITRWISMHRCRIGRFVCGAYRFGVCQTIAFGYWRVCVDATMSEQKQVACVRANRLGMHFW